MRYLKREVFPDRKFIIMTDLSCHPFIQDFVEMTIGLPKEFYDLDLDRDCYEAVEKGSPAGSLTSTDVYTNLIEYFRAFYNKDKAIEIWTPRGCNTIINNEPQLFCKFSAPIVKLDKPIITALPRKRTRSSFRNIPEFIWKETIEELSKSFIVVIAGTKNGAACANLEGENIINIVGTENLTEKTISYLCSSVCSISSQSGGTHISLLSGCPSYIVGHEKKRHSRDSNRLDIPVSFRTLNDYRAIDADTIVDDISNFLQMLNQYGYLNPKNKIFRPSLHSLIDSKDLVGVEIGVYDAANAINMLETLDIKKLYLIDPYTSYAGKEQDNSIVYEQAFKRLDAYKDKIEFIKDTSANAVDKIEDSLDFVYVDGNHRYEFVKEDISLYFPKLRDGGLMAFHDFDPPDENNGVIQAVEEAFKGKLPIYADVCIDDPKTHEGWVFKPTKFDNIIEDEVESLNSLLQERL